MGATDAAVGGGAELSAYSVPVDGAGVRAISPTDVSQFIRLDQCRRYLRLRLHERVAGRDFLRDEGVAPQAISPLLSRAGAGFEAEVVAAVAARHRALDFAAGKDPAARGDDNAEVAAAARDLPAGDSLVLVQPRLVVDLAGWRIRGDADLVHLARDAGGDLRALIVDAKSSTAAKVEHRLQVAFYHELLAALLAEHDVPCTRIETGILYRPAPDPTISREDAATLARRATEGASARDRLGVPDALLEVVADADGYRGAVRDLVTGETSVARRAAEAPFEEIPFHLTYKCDGCLYTEFCMKRAAERDDLSLLPFLREPDKAALHRLGLQTVGQVAHVKQPLVDPQTGEEDGRVLVPAPGQEALVRAVGATWPIGPRLDELVHRARRYRRFKGEELTARSTIPSRGYPSLPYCGVDHNPNLVRVYVDAQHDYLNDRVYLLGALVVGAERGETPPRRRRNVVALAAGPPTNAGVERALFLDWIDQLLRAIIDVATPDEEGQPRAPIHLVFFDRYEQRVLLDGLGRHAGAILGATPLYDFVTQLAAFDSPVASFLDEEIREHKNYPMVCQSLPAVAAFLKFDWNRDVPYRDLFRERHFDFWGRTDRTDPAAADGSPWYFARARFGSQIPLEYAYAAWGDLPDAADGRDDYRGYRAATPDLLRRFQGRRLEAIEHVAADFVGNRQTLKSSFELPALDRFEDRARSLADALDEFMIIERHVALAAWKRARLPPPERRVVAGETLVGRYVEADQAPGVAGMMRENERRRLLREEQDAAFRAARPDAMRVSLTKEEREESEWKSAHEGMSVHLRLELADVDAELDQIPALLRFKPGERVVLHPRWHFDTRLPTADQVPLQPTAKQLLRAGRATFEGLRLDPAAGRPQRAWIDLTLHAEGPSDNRGFAFRAYPRPLAADALYTLDPDPNDPSGMTAAKVTAGLREGGESPLLDRLLGRPRPVAWPAAAAAGQARYLAGLDLLHAAGALHGFEPGKRAFIAEHGADPTLLVQGPPGTGKSYTTAFALLARLQGAMAAGLEQRIVLSCKTHAAVDVLLENLIRVRNSLAELLPDHPTAAACFDRRLFDVPLFRLRPRGEVAPEVIPLHPAKESPKGTPKMAQRLSTEAWAVAAGTPGSVYNLVKEHGGQQLFGHGLIDTLVLDEASQMSLPEAALAALPLKPDGRLIVVGDHRQMPPIIQHDWAGEARRTFHEYRTYESLFATLLLQEPPTIRFEESFRLHAEIAEFLRREVYAQDGIAYHSRRLDLLPPADHADPLVAAVLEPNHPLVVIVHDEAGSQARNPFEQALVTPILEALAARGFDAVDGLGVVVPHRAQRAALQESVPALTTRHPDTGAVLLSAVDTVERFQGGERTAIVIGATESDPAYLLLSAGFLLDPRRLTVALSRAKRKLVLVAARSVFDFFSPDEETFRHAQLWKNLLHRTCTVPLWRGERDGVAVEVWGNAPSLRPVGSGSDA